MPIAGSTSSGAQQLTPDRDNLIDPGGHRERLGERLPSAGTGPEVRGMHRNDRLELGG
jgi:hypothetical protein